MLRRTLCLLGAMAAPAFGAAAAVEAPSFSVPDAGVLTNEGAWCIDAVSKDFCAYLYAGGVRKGECIDADGNICRSIWLQQWVWEGEVKSHEGQCFHGCDFAICVGPCDEIRDGKLSLTFDAIIRDRSGDCCNYFGCWSGTWELKYHNRVFTGTANGTIGRGSNRGTVCDYDDTDVCETCHEVEYRNDGTWLIGFEGSFFGADELGSVLCFTTDGDWVIPGTCDGGPDFTAAEVFKGEAALEGAQLNPCFQ